jgi:hypothetical protein
MTFEMSVILYMGTCSPYYPMFLEGVKMMRFLFGVIIGVLLTLYLQAKGDDILKGIGIDSRVISGKLKSIKEVTQTFFKDESPEKAKEPKKNVNPPRPTPN